MPHVVDTKVSDWWNFHWQNSSPLGCCASKRTGSTMFHQFLATHISMTNHVFALIHPYIFNFTNTH